jgi:SAM-dependent MidA family methyltransferase
VVTALEDLPALELTGVVLANELFDNLVFGIAERTGNGWSEVRVGLDPAGGFCEVLVAAEPGDGRALDAATEGVGVAEGARLPLPRGIDAWLASCARMLRHGIVIMIDYVDSTRGVLDRGARDWLRTYRNHERGGSPLVEPGAFDITADVVREQVLHAARRAGMRLADEQSQAEWLRDLGIDELAEEGRRTWEARAHIGDLEALAGRSRVAEASALTDPAGLGAHRVLTFAR